MKRLFYNYIDAGLLSVDTVDLLRITRYRTLSHKKPVRVDKQCHVDALTRFWKLILLRF